MIEKTALDHDELVALLVCNVEHARHVENERLSFNSIHIAVVAGFFALAFDFEKPLLTVFLIGILLIISVIGLLFTKRWTDVFEGHYLKAQEIAMLLYGEEAPNDHEDLVNKYYYFKHDYLHHKIMAKIRLEAKTGKQPAYNQTKEQLVGSLWQRFYQRPFKVRTAHLFYFFYGIIIMALLCFFVYGLVLLFWG